MTNPQPPRWLKPMNRFMMAVQKLGLHTGPAYVLTVPGRKSGKPRSTPMTPFSYDGGLYTVAGYPGADWARNAKAAGTGTLSRGADPDGSGSSNSGRRNRNRCCGHFPNRYRSE